LRPIGLTGRQLIILGAITEQGTLRRAVPAEVLGKNHTTVMANLAPLTGCGLVASPVDHDDRRARTVALAPDGDRILDQSHCILGRFDAELCARIQGEGDMKNLRAALETLLQRQRTSGSLAGPFDQTE
jgi:DNA-binding MarR family transcriptional regulator